MTTRTQTKNIVAKLVELRDQIAEIADGLHGDRDASGSRHAERVLRCAASDIEIARSSLRLQADRDDEITSPGRPAARPSPAAVAAAVVGPRSARQSIPTPPREFKIQKYDVRGVGGRGVAIEIISPVSPGPDSVFWSERSNSFVIVDDDRRGAWRTTDGKRVSLMSISGRGEIRWPVTSRNADESQGSIEHFELTEWTQGAR